MCFNKNNGDISKNANDGSILLLIKKEIWKNSYLSSIKGCFWSKVVKDKRNKRIRSCCIVQKPVLFKSKSNMKKSNPNEEITIHKYKKDEKYENQ